MHCNVKTRCEALKALAQKKLGTDDPAAGRTGPTMCCGSPT